MTKKLLCQMLAPAKMHVESGASGILSLESRLSKTLDLPPSCIDFCQKVPEYFIVGTYHLETEDDQTTMESSSKPQQRSGSLILFCLERDFLNSIQTVQTPAGVLDLHFSPHEQDVLAVALSTGALSFYRLRLKPGRLEHVSTMQLFPRSTLVLSATWAPQHDLAVALTVSSGSVYVAKMQPRSFVVRSMRRVLKHEEQAWTSAFTSRHFVRHSHQKPLTGTEQASSLHSQEQYQAIDGELNSQDTRLYSGGDDGSLRSVSLNFLNLRVGSLPQSMQKPFEAGVTAILALPFESSGFDPKAPSELSCLLLTGSYDDHVRLINPDTSRVLADQKLGGGVWRLKFFDGHGHGGVSGTITGSPAGQNEPTSYLVLASCMHAGARVLRLVKSGDDWSIDILAEFTEHKSMCYASDVQPSPFRDLPQKDAQQLMRENGLSEPKVGDLLRRSSLFGRSVEELLREDGLSDEGVHQLIHEAAETGKSLEQLMREASHFSAERSGSVGRVKPENHLCVSTSFYDKLLCVWDFVVTA